MPQTKKDHRSLSRTNGAMTQVVLSSTHDYHVQTVILGHQVLLLAL